jgi:superfamily II DNA or RNA helicase
MKNHRNWRDIYEHGIIHNVRRNKIIAKQMKKLADMGRKILVIVQEVKHGKIIRELAQRESVRTLYVDGGNTYGEREKALKHLSSGKIDAIIATNIFDEGIDVKDISAVVLAAGTKSAPALFQRTGRAIRRKENENYAIVIDFIDQQHRKLYEHSMRRYNLIKHEKGFTIL